MTGLTINDIEADCPHPSFGKCIKAECPSYLTQRILTEQEKRNMLAADIPVLNMGIEKGEFCAAYGMMYCGKTIVLEES